MIESFKGRSSAFSRSTRKPPPTKSPFWWYLVWKDVLEDFSIRTVESWKRARKKGTTGPSSGGDGGAEDAHRVGCGLEGAIPDAMASGSSTKCWSGS